MFLSLATVAGRSLRQLSREPETLLLSLALPAFFFVVFVGALEKIGRQQTGVDFKAFQLPVAVLFATTGASRAQALVKDIQDGSFDRICTTPVRRVALLLGLMIADSVLVIGLMIPLLALGLLAGIGFTTGPAGVLLFVSLAVGWGAATSGFLYAVALKTASASAVGSASNLFFPFAFLTTSLLPKGALTGWMSVAATYNPVTYLLAGLRSLVYGGWNGAALLQAFLAVAGVATISLSLALAALGGRLDPS